MSMNKIMILLWIKVKKRPHVDEFLQGLVEMNYDIAVWTAAKHEYAIQIELI